MRLKILKEKGRFLGSDDKIREAIQMAKGGKIHIAPSKKGTFTAAATRHGKSVQAFVSQVLAHPENYSPAMRKKANFARVASKWKHGDGGLIEKYEADAVRSALGRVRTFARGGDFPPSSNPVILEGGSGEVRVPSNMFGSDDAIRSVQDYYASDGYRTRMKDAGLDPQVVRLPKVEYYYDMDPLDAFNDGNGIEMGVKPVKYEFPVSVGPDGKTRIDRGLVEAQKNYSGYYPAIIAAHEVAHSNPLFNTVHDDWYKAYSPDSPYYGKDYSNIPEWWKRVLQPVGATNTHDMELNESYSDLMGLRYFLQKNGIYDSLKPGAVFTPSMYDKMIDTVGADNLRFSNYHTKQQTIDAINDIASKRNAATGRMGLMLPVPSRAKV